ncbi:MAG: AEC family transporter [Proteobacteria bacterium]|nr:AEC family transporter [Pseudomonadota bacterium]
MIPVVNNILPVFAVILAGQVLGRRSIVPAVFFQTSDRLVYFFFFPVLLFWKIGGADPSAGPGGRIVLIVLGAVFSTWVLSLFYAAVSGMSAFRIGAFSQCCYRFNSYIGLAVVLSVLGESGVRDFGIIIGLAIPFINVLAVTTLIWFGQKSYGLRDKVRLVIKAMIANPLILSCLLGMAYARLNVPFPPFVDNTFRLISTAALPLALLSVGNSLTLNKLKHYLGPALASCGLKLVFLPVLGYVLLRGFGVTGQLFQVALLYFAMPTSAVAFILSSQLGSDPDLASACTVLSTLLSLVSLSIVLLL